MCFTHSRVSEASTVFQLIIFLTLAEDATGQFKLDLLFYLFGLFIIIFLTLAEDATGQLK
jgi:hypothetical protein